MQREITEAIKVALQELDNFEGAKFVVERSDDFTHGDYTTNAAMVAMRYVADANHAHVNDSHFMWARFKSSNPHDLAEFLKEKLEGKIAGVKEIKVEGPGFINFFLAAEYVAEQIKKAANESWGKNDLYKGKTVMVEYTDPNPFKEFHIGHLMSNTIGEAIARTLENAGAKVIRANYQGDVGCHVAKAMHVLLLENKENPTIADISAAYVEGAKRYEEDPAEKVAIDHLNKTIYQQYENVTEDKIWSLYQKARKISLDHFEELYKILGTTFNCYFFESETSPIGKNLVTSHPEVFEDSTSAKIFPGEKVGLHTRVFLTSSPYNLPTYEAKDLGLLELKKEKESHLDESITITASEQNEYFKVVLAAAKEIPELQDIANKTKHVSHGMMRFAEGKMSSRKGNVITGESLLMDLKDAAKEKVGERKLQDADKVAEQVAVGAIKYAVLKQGSGKDIVFDPEKSLSLEGDSGPYLQYAHVRALSLLRAGRDAKVISEQSNPSSAADILERTLLHFPEVVERAARELEPHYVTTHLTEIASLFNSWYASERAIVGGMISQSLFDLVQAVERTLASGLHILGIPAPEEM